MGKWAIEVPQELGSSCRLHGRIPAGATGQPTPGPPLAHAAAAGAKKSVLPWYRQTKATKCGGRDGRKSQCLDSTVEAGEQSPERTPGREARHRVHGTVVGRYGECLEIRQAYSRNSNG